MRKYILLILLVVVGLSSEVYGQQAEKVKSIKRTYTKFTPKGFHDVDPLLPRRDTVIMLGDEIEVGGYLSEEEVKQFEIIGYGKAKKSDYKKKFDHKKGLFDNKYSIKLKPKKTTTYEFKWIEHNGSEAHGGRKVYVAKTAEEKKQLEEKIQADLGQYQLTTYQYTYPGNNVKVTMSRK